MATVSSFIFVSVIKKNYGPKGWMDKKSIFRLMVSEGESIMESEIRQQAVRAES